jgi:VIT1/CCC1 family predicted Fe2+/Mn2+ transporter
VRGKALVTEFKELEASSIRLPDKTMLLLLSGGFIMLALVFGVLSGIVLSLVGSKVIYMLIAAVLAFLFSFAAIVSKTPMMADKVVWNVLIGMVLGIIVPLLTK